MSEIQATLLVLGLIAATAAFIAVTCLASPRPTPAADLSVECPLTGRRVVAQLVWDDWTGQWGDVARCSALDGHPDVLCVKQCLVAENRRVLSDSGTRLKAAAGPMTLDTSEAVTLCREPHQLDFWVSRQMPQRLGDLVSAGDARGCAPQGGAAGTSR